MASMTAIYILGLAAAFVLMRRKKLNRKSAGVMMAGSIAALCLEAAVLLGESNVPLTEIARDGKSGTEKTVELDTESEGERTSVRIQIFPQQYTDAEWKELCEEMWTVLEGRIIGENNSLDYVTKDLIFPESVEGYPFLIRWESSRPELLRSDGQIGEEIPAEGALVEIRAHISAADGAFSEERIFYAELFASQEKDAFWRRLQKKLAGMEEESRKDGSYILPESFEGKEVTFYKKKENKSAVIFFAAAAGAAAVYVAEKEEKEKRRHKRLADMEREYPEMVSRMAMLIGAGMTVPGAFRRIAADYDKRKQETRKPLYEELLVACREMQAGISERTAYQNMGIRCGLPCVVRFTTLLIRYTKSGASGFKKALRGETDQALRERKERARRSGEEAGTKLLVPMILMLVLVMVIVMIPAFTSFGM